MKYLITILIFFSKIFSHECNIIDPLNYGDCEMLLGWSWTQDGCNQISGCSTINNDGIDDSDLFYDSEYYCIQECTIHNSNYGDMNDDNNIDVVDIVIIVNIILDNTEINDHFQWAGDLNFDDIIDILDIIITIDLILDNEYENMNTWEIIQNEILDPNCVSCHNVGHFYAEQSGLILTSDVAYQSLINTPPVNSSAYDDGLVLVSNEGGLLGLQLSYLWEKLDIWNQEHYFAEHPNYGSIMPMGGPYLTRGQLDFIEQWIFAGAPNTGVVADVVLLNNDNVWSEPEFEPLDPPENGIQIHLEPFNIWENNEREIFYYTPLDTNEDLFIKQIEISMAPGSHHFILYTFENIPNAFVPNPYQIRDLHYENGDYNASQFYVMNYHQFIAGTQIPYTNYSMPEGVALRMSNQYGFDINSHYLNYSDSLHYGEVYANIHLIDPSEVEHIAHILQLSNQDFILPAGEETTIESTYMFTPGWGDIPNNTESISIFQLFSHAHELMTRFDVELVGGNNDGELIYTALDWEHPPILQLDPPLIISDGQGLKLKVTYNNWRNEDVEFGFFSTDEMMILFGHFYAN